MLALAALIFLIFVISTASAATAQNNSPLITETQISTSGSAPAIYGDRIVWQDDRNGNWDIYMYDLSTKKENRITTSKSNQIDPAIYGNRIVWDDDQNGNRDIYMYDLSTKKENKITTSGKALKPRIYGNRIVWMDGRNGGSLDEGNWADGNWDIYMYDLSTCTEYQITTNESTQKYPDIYEDKIVWEDNRSIDYKFDIFMYNLSTKKETCIYNEICQNDNPKIYGDRVVCMHEDAMAHYFIIAYNISTSTTQDLGEYDSYSCDPAIYGNRIVWTDGRKYVPADSDNYDIYMYDLSTSTETQITTDESSQGSPAIYGDRIVWEDYRSPGGIYMATLSYGPSLPVADFSASPTSGKTPLNVKFTDTSTGSPTSWYWNFGDGSKSYLQNPTHKYSKVGSYTVSLTVKNAKGSNKVTKTDYIIVITKPVAAFSASPTSGKAPLKVKFTDKSTGTPTKWKWNFGDGTISREKNPTHQYTQKGNYKITLTVSNAAGSNTITKTNFIKVTTDTRPGIYSENK
ncbi:PKD domain-containing protein [Methanosarcina sp. DH1]|uniref:PKD domain-containing protein n=1 Tax=Methanosarcina sp. DH1 TaxID=2605695 RepID=UPI001E48D55B